MSFILFYEFVGAPLFVAGVIGGITLLWKSRNSLRKTVEELVGFRNYLIGDPKVKKDEGKIGEMDNKLDELLRRSS